MKHLKIQLPYLACVAAATFLLPPFLAKSMGGAMVLLFGILPGVCGVCGLLLGKKAGLRWEFGVLCGVLFLVSIPVFYNSSALLYAAINAGCALAGLCIGSNFAPQEPDEPDASSSDAPDADDARAAPKEDSCTGGEDSGEPETGR